MRHRLVLVGAACVAAWWGTQAAPAAIAAPATAVASAPAPTTPGKSAAGVASAPAATTPAPGKPAPRAAAPLKVSRVTLGIRHRVFPDFSQQVAVKMQERFPVGDTDYAAQIVQFMPHFDYDIKKRRARNISNELKNPAFRVIVRQKGVPKDTSWVFLNSPPHFARTSMLAFQVLRVDFENRAPLVADTSAAGKAAR